jgi:predicted nucleotidyltransferase
MIIKEEILKNQKDFNNLCKNHNVKYLYAFGSSVSEQFDFKKSDIDLLVEIDSKDPIDRGEKLLSLWDLFEVFFHRKVDLLTDCCIVNPFLRKSIDSTKVLIYDRSGQNFTVTYKIKSRQKDLPVSGR